MSVRKGNALGRLARRIGAWLTASWVEDRLAGASADIPRHMPILVDAPRSLTIATATAIAPVISEIFVEMSPEPDVLPVAASQACPEISGELQASAMPRAAKSLGLAARLAAVSKLNAPSSRAARRNGMIAPAGRAVPLALAVEVKTVKERRLPTAVAFRPARKPSYSAEIIDLAAVRGQARGQQRARMIKRAA